MKSKEDILFYNADFTACLTDNARDAIFRAMNEYAKGKCEEQRTICSRMVSGWPNEILTEGEIEERITNAKEPEF